MMEYWKNGKLGLEAEKVSFSKNKIPFHPLFQHSIILISKGESSC
jgi:hypothetical protein